MTMLVRGGSVSASSCHVCKGRQDIWHNITATWLNDVFSPRCNGGDDSGTATWRLVNQAKGNTDTRDSFMDYLPYDATTHEPVVQDDVHLIMWEHSSNDELCSDGCFWAWDAWIMRYLTEYPSASIGFMFTHFKHDDETNKWITEAEPPILKRMESYALETQNLFAVSEGVYGFMTNMTKEEAWDGHGGDVVSRS